MEQKVDMVEVREFMAQMLECMKSQEYKDATKDMTLAETTAAMWGIAFSSLYANLKSKHYILPVKEFTETS